MSKKRARRIAVRFEAATVRRDLLKRQAAVKKVQAELANVQAAAQGITVERAK
jgi:hypothetical protein